MERTPINVTLPPIDAEPEEIAQTLFPEAAAEEAKGRPMNRWSRWQPFPDPRLGGYLSAPFGLGVYELRNRKSGELVLYGKARTSPADVLHPAQSSRSGNAEQFGQEGLRPQTPSRY